MGWLTGWNLRRSHVINAAAGAGDHYQVCIKVYKTTGENGTETINGVTAGKVYVGSNCRDDFGDICFTGSNGTTVLDCWMQTFTSGTSAIFWVEVTDSLESVAQTIYVYYKKDDAVTTSNGVNTFILFDHLDSSSGWTLSSRATIANSKLTITPAGLAKGQFGYRTWTPITDYRVRYSYYADTNNAAVILAVRGSVQPVENVSCIGLGSPCVHEYDHYYSSFNFRFYSVSNISTGTTTIAKSSTPQFVTLTKVGSLYSVTRNDSPTKTCTDATPETGAYIVYGVTVTISSGSAVLDWLFISKYVNPEPEHSTWGSEETPILTLSASETLSFLELVISFRKTFLFEALLTLEVLFFPWYPKNIWELLHLIPTSQKRAELASKEETIQLSDLSTPAWCQPLIEGLSLAKNLLNNAYKSLTQTLDINNYSTSIVYKPLGQTIQLVESFFIAKLALLLDILKVRLSSSSLQDPEELLDEYPGAVTEQRLERVHPTSEAKLSAIGQCFTVPDPGYRVITKATFRLLKTGTPTGTIVARVYSMTGTYGSTGIPEDVPVDSQILAESDPFDVSQVSNSFTWKDFIFSGDSQILLQDQHYCIVLVVKSGTFDSTNFLRVSISGTDVHSGNLCYYLSSLWQVWSSRDTSFKVYGRPVAPNVRIVPILFSTSFETGNLIRLDTFGGNPLPSIVTSQHHHGSYSLYIYGNWTYTWAQKAIASNPVHVSAWIYKANSWSFYKPAYTITVRSQDGTLIASFCMEAATVSKMGVYYRNNSSYVTLDTDLDWPIEQWWQYELRVLTGAGTGEVKLWVNRTLKINLTGLNNADKGEPKYMELGTRGHSSGYGPDLYFDCVVASNEYIGMAGEPAPQEKFYTQILSLPGICLNRFTKWLFPSSNFSDVIISFSTKKVLKEQEWVLLREVED